VALADPARPSNYRTEVTVTAEGVIAQIRGGDAFVVLTVEPGNTTLPGYEGEPYPRVEADGTVLANERSPAYWLNNNRYGQVRVPTRVSSLAEPVGVEVAEDGSHAWHDHRVHWMLAHPPPGVDRSRETVVQPWVIPVE
jgi:hypothetical protein